MKHLNINKKRLVQFISECLQPSEVSKPYLWFTQDGITVNFGREDAEAYKAAQNMLLDFDELTDKYSTKAITSSFRRLLVQLLTGYENSVPSVEEIKNKLDAWLIEMITAKEHEFTYFVVIENLKLSRKLSIGQVELEPLTQEKIDELVDKVNAVLDEDSYYADKEQERERLKQLNKNDILSQFNPKERAALASTKLLVRDVAKEFEAAHKRFQEVLHLLRFLGGFVYEKSYKAHIGFRGELYWGHTAYLALSDDAGWKFNQSVAGYLFEFGVTAKYLEFFRNMELDIFSAILSKAPNEQTDIERRLISSIIWVSRSTFDSSEHEQFIMLCIALENLLGGDVKEGITKILAERLALLLEDERDKRIEIFKNASEILRIRGEVVHTGQPKDERKLLEYLPLVFGYVSWAIIKTTRLMKEHRWNKFSDFTNYLTELKFS